MSNVKTFGKAPVVGGKPDYLVRDLAQAGFGRKEIDLAETEMPGLVATREEFKAAQPGSCARAWLVSASSSVLVSGRGLP